MKKNILYICTPDSIHDLKWMCFFANQKNDFEIFAIGEKNSYSSNSEALLQANNITLLEPLCSFSIRTPYSTIKSIFHIQSIIKKHNINLVHVLFAAPYSIWLNFLSAPSIITTRGSDVLVLFPNLLSGKGIKRIYLGFLFFLFKRSFNKANFVTCTSNRQIEKVKELFHTTRCLLVRTGVDVEEIHKIDKPALILEELRGRNYVLSPRFMAPIYNIHYQIEALLHLNKNIIDSFVFVFIRGKNYNENYYKAQLIKLEELKKNISLNYLIVDFFEQEALWMHLKRAHLVLMTPISDGTPNSALEAMAAKTPLIISDLPLYDSELFENSCIKVPLNNSEKLATSITSVLTHRSSEKIEKAYNIVLEYGNRKIEMNKLAKLYS